MDKWSSLDDAIKDDFYFLICTSQFSQIVSNKVVEYLSQTQKGIYTVLFHVYEVKKQEKLIYADRV